MPIRLFFFFFYLVLVSHRLHAESRPNILFLFADDLGRYASIYRTIDRTPGLNAVVNTPHLDALAREGTLFRNAFVNAPSCTPCRSSILTGQQFFRTGRGAVLHGAPWDSTIPCYPLLLKEAGYFLGKTAKVWSPGTPVDAPYGGKEHAFESAGLHFNTFNKTVLSRISKGEPIEAAKSALIAQVLANFESFITAPNRRPDQPWCYWFGPTNTHRGWGRDGGKTLWGIDPDSLKGHLPSHLPDVPEIRADIADYLGEIQAFDAMIGAILDRLRAANMYEKTFIAVSGDHGMPGVPGGKCNLYDLGTAVSLIIRMPGPNPSLNPPGGVRVLDDFVSLPDLAPTFLDLAGLPIPSVMTGRSLLPILRSDRRAGQVDPSRDHVLLGRERHFRTARAGNLPYPQRGLRTADFLFIRNFAPDRWPMGDPALVTPSPDEIRGNTEATFPDMDASPTKAWLIEHRDDPAVAPYYHAAFAKRPGEELYDLRVDPGQRRNVAYAPEYAATREALAKQLLTELTALGDPRVTMDPAPYDLPPFTDVQPRKKKTP